MSDRFLSVSLQGVTYRSGSDIWCFRPPWNEPLFSERNGFVAMKWRAFGWRLFKRDALNQGEPQ